MCATKCFTPGPQRLREVRVHVPEVDGEPRVSAGGGGGRRGQAQAQGDQYYTISTISTISISTYIYIYTYLYFFTIPGGEAARPDHLYHHQPQPGNFILLQT